ncbi:MAG: hypothetical protein ABSE28_01785 [Candidatus Sulfotelmatobacter sp.]|jgi:hypothetical protein
MANQTIPNPVDQKRWKQLFEGSLTSLNGGSIPIKQQPIFRPRQNRATALEAESSKAALTIAANSLAALWQISTLRRPHRSE